MKKFKKILMSLIPVLSLLGFVFLMDHFNRLELFSLVTGSMSVFIFVALKKLIKFKIIELEEKENERKINEDYKSEECLDYELSVADNKFYSILDKSIESDIDNNNDICCGNCNECNKHCDR